MRIEQQQGVWLQPVIGEAGAGKSRLLREWAGRLADCRIDGRTIRLALVPLRSLQPAEFGVRGTALALLLVGAAVDLEPAPRSSTDASALPDLWLFDGLDELPEGVWEAGFGDALTQLPGAKIATCRNAVYPSRRHRLAEALAVRWSAPLEILKLNRGERLAFLAARLGQVDVASFDRAIQDLPALAPLADHPLLLELMIEIGMPLPQTRVEFFRTVEARMGARRARGTSHDQIWPRAAAALDRLAAAMTLGRREAPGGLLAEACGGDGDLRAALLDSGLVAFDRAGDRMWFLHATFQDYHQARQWHADLGSAQSGHGALAAVLAQHWQDPQAEEALSLLLALEAGARGGAQGVGRALDSLLALGLRLWHEKAPAIVKEGRSPTRVALHLMAHADLGPAAGGRLASQRWIATLATNVRMMLAQDRRTPGPILEMLARDSYGEVKACVGGNPSAPAGLLATLADDPIARSYVAENPSAPFAVLEALARDGDPWIRRSVAGNPSAPAELLKALAGDTYSEVRSCVATNLSASARLLKALARDAEREVKASVAGNPSAPTKVLAALARDGDPWIRRAVAGNPSAPVALLKALAADAESEVKSWVAGNPSAPIWLLETLARDRVHQVKDGLATNPSVPAELLEALARDSSYNLRMTVASNRSAPAAVLTELARDSHPEVRARVAENASSPAVALEALARDDVPRVRFRVAENPSAPVGLLLKLARDGDGRLRFFSARDLSIPVHLQLGDQVTIDYIGARGIGRTALDNPALPLEAMIAEASILETPLALRLWSWATGLIALPYRGCFSPIWRGVRAAVFAADWKATRRVVIEGALRAIGAGLIGGIGTLLIWFFRDTLGLDAWVAGLWSIVRAKLGP